MRKILPIALVVASMGAFVQSGLAADIPARAPARVAPLTAPAYAAFSWTGCYIGANVGYGFNNADGLVGGGQLGCDLQTGALVLGLEGMFDWSGMDGSHTDISWVAAVTGRIGFAVDRGLFYVKGGAAWVDADHSFRGVNFGGNDDANTGWTVGAGAEWAFAPGWSAKLEYNFMDFGSDTPRFCVGGGCGRGFDGDQNIHLVTVGVNYRFSWH